MPKKSEVEKEQSFADINELNRMLAAVLTYLSDDAIEEIDIEYLLDHTDGLREWWEHYREQNRKQIEEEITQSLEELSLEELERLRQQIKEKKSSS
ncbi:hypothetical protein EKG37_04090 [Robertmurraya yapensis]|uniref:Uncharacterized protein n=2 Tax=Bacillaceae TaxID=186817 RepID=A0A3S0J179_9BACI|nr:hypothetical protein [Bacillus yapensis]RTR35821.1 hypothetical protein EKG37_04090 [Bacillus yapensis]TKS98623.1 hypothetical protein FAR12_04090 [Bacillus yapensis]